MSFRYCCVFFFQDEFVKRQLWVGLWSVCILHRPEWHEMRSFVSKFGLSAVINAAGTMTNLGAAAANEDAVAAARDILSEFVEMPELQRVASETISQVCRADAGCVTACVASAISISVAATMTGDDLAKIEALPDTHNLKNEVVLQKGHSCHFSGDISQMVRLSGANPVEIGAVNRTTSYQLEGALNERSAAGLYVVSHQTSQTGMLGLKEFAEICHSQNVPVIVDASAEYDLNVFLEQGADLVLYSAHKFLGGLRAGIIAGRKDLVRACYLQEYGIGRAMKVGKEGIASTIAVLRRWEKLDKESLWQAETARSESAVGRFSGIDGIIAKLEADPTGNPINRVRLRFDSIITGIDPQELSRVLASETPAVYVRAHDTDPTSLLLDPCNLTDEDMEYVTKRIIELLKNSVTSGLKLANVPRSENVENWPDPPPDTNSHSTKNPVFQSTKSPANLVTLKMKRDR